MLKNRGILFMNNDAMTKHEIDDARFIKILLIGGTLSKNRGTAAIVIGAVRALQEVIPNSHFTLLSPFPELDHKKGVAYGLNVIGFNIKTKAFLSLISRSIFWNILHRLGIAANALINEDTLKKYFYSDIIIDLSGDGFSDDYGIKASVFSCWNILLSKILEKPIVIYAQSIGPFKYWLTRFLSVFCLNKVDLLIVRENITKNYLKNIGVYQKIYLAADPAFLLEAASPDRICDILRKENVDRNKQPIVGFSVSQHLYEIDNSKSPRINRYVLIMARIIDYIITTFNAQILLIPHVTNTENTIDDRFVGEKIFEHIQFKKNIILINNEYTSEELKGIISQCNVFIGARMHANIAAVSMCVPTLAIAYSHKTYGIMKLLNMEKYIVDFKTMTFEEFIQIFNEIWHNQNVIRTSLEFNIKKIKEKAKSSAFLVNELLSQRI